MFFSRSSVVLVIIILLKLLVKKYKKVGTCIITCLKWPPMVWHFLKSGLQAYRGSLKVQYRVAFSSSLVLFIQVYYTYLRKVTNLIHQSSLAYI